MTTPPLEVTGDANGDIAVHSPWMLRLARGLLGDASAADDVVQDAWTKLGGARREPGYVAAVVRSIARHRQRDEGRRSRREEHAARIEALPSTAEVAERAELARKLAEAIEQLKEPYRTTIVLRYYDDLSSAEIARRAGVPAATVRARLKRGLDVLRERLDQRDGGRTKWVGALLPLTRAEAEGSAAAAASLATVLSIKLVLASAVALGGLALVWTVVALRGNAETPPITLTATDTGPRDVPTTRSEPRLDDPSARAEAVVATEIAPAPATVPVRGRVLARARDASGEAARDAWLRLRRVSRRAAEGDADGRLTLELEPGELEQAAQGQLHMLEVELGAKGFRTRYLHPYLAEGASELDLGDVSLEPGGAVSGRVVDGSGLGVEGALVAAGLPTAAEPGDPGAALNGPHDLDVDPWDGRGPAEVGRTGPGGAFRIEGIAAGYHTVWARMSTGLWSHSEPVGLRAGDEVFDVELVVSQAPERVITGTVVDPHGRPLSGLELTFTKSNAEDGWWNVRTDARGAFYFAPRDGSAQDITATSPSWEWADEERLEVAAGTHELEIAFELSKWLTVAAVDPDGQLVRHGTVEGLPGSGPTEYALSRCESALDERGSARLRRPNEALRVRVRAFGYRDRIVGPIDPALFPDPLVVSLAPLPALVGQVLRTDGRPAAAVTVSLHRAASDGSGVTPPGARNDAPAAHLTHQGWSGDREPFVYAVQVTAASSVLTDENGRFRLPLPGVDTTSEDEVDAPKGPFAGMGYVGGSKSVATSKAGQPWYVHAALEGSASATSGPHVFDPTRDAELDLELPRGGAVAGRLVLEGSASPTGWTIYASDALARIVRAPVASDGTFELRELHAGGWQVRAFEPGRPYFPGRMRTSRVPEPDVEVVASATVAYEHTSSARASARLSGRFWIDGAPPGPWQVIVRTTTSAASIMSYKTTLDPDGHFAVSLEPGLKTSILLHNGMRDGQISLNATATVVAGDNDWSFDWITARIEGRFDAAETKGFANTRPSYESEQGEVTIRTAVLPDDEGRFGPLRVCAGPGVLRGPRENFREPGPVWAELDLEAGETRSVSLR
jgi:RNA polymerase sigma factor (sigma-70 family)